ncbi:MAG: aspartate--tRNA ligase [Planctomycetota bacterium]|nr:MAG: aspartate--tRNA ligase [Planctomycetota bacterium]
MKLKRTHTCGEIAVTDAGTEVVLSGWVENKRDHGGMLFVDLKDRYGITQVVFDPQRNEALYAEGKELKPESVISIRGVVQRRPEGNVNPDRKTGEIEIIAEEVEVLNRSATPPFEIVDDCGASEEVRMKYRYLDLRRDVMRENIIFRHRVYQSMRRYLSEEGFIEVETPTLIKSTPEGARDYLVPSRKFSGRFFALPQSPQIFKQLLMIAGFDRYFQIARCYRDEDIRADRQPEFTQLDIEMTFVDEDDVIAMNEGQVRFLMKDLLGIEVGTPFKRLAFDEALKKYGLDAPDIRFGMTLVDVSDVCADAGFKVFQAVVASGGIVAGINAKGASNYSRRQLDELTAYVGEYGAKGLVWFKVEEEGGTNVLKSPTAKFFDEGRQQKIIEKTKAEAGDLLLFVADGPDVARTAVGRLRVRLARQLDLIPKNTFELCWVTEFPMFEVDEESGRLAARHHPFTSPTPATVDDLEKKPLRVRARAYDLVVNGVEIAGGSIRINTPELQRRVFKALGIGEKEAGEKFGFLIEALKYGAPPHGGIAYGFDRFVAILRGIDRIRDVIAFPKTTTAQCLLSGAPSPVDEKQLEELKLKIIRERDSSER